jgi:uncharacterized paraquat-inducible protein A
MFKKADWIFVALAVLVVIGVSLLPSPRDQNPPVPDTQDHRAITAEPECLRCHVVGGARPLPARHPKRQDCFRCHRRM